MVGHLTPATLLKPSLKPPLKSPFRQLSVTIEAVGKLFPLSILFISLAEI